MANLSTCPVPVDTAPLTALALRDMTDDFGLARCWIGSRRTSGSAADELSGENGERGALDPRHAAGCSEFGADLFHRLGHTGLRRIVVPDDDAVAPFGESQCGAGIRQRVAVPVAGVNEHEVLRAVPGREIELERVAEVLSDVAVRHLCCDQRTGNTFSGRTLF